MILLLALVALSQADLCPKGHKYDEVTKKCYAFINEPLSFYEARSACLKRFGYELISIHNHPFNLYAQRLAHLYLDKDNGSFWIGAATALNMHWVWEDNTPFDFENFASEELLRLNFCAYLHALGRGTWSVDDCSQGAHQALCFGSPKQNPAYNQSTINIMVAQYQL